MMAGVSNRLARSLLSETGEGGSAHAGAGPHANCLQKTAWHDGETTRLLTQKDVPLARTKRLFRPSLMIAKESLVRALTASAPSRGRATARRLA
eukprot:2625087-Pleurochrysis_carterae.AAC.1